MDDEYIEWWKEQISKDYEDMDGEVPEEEIESWRNIDAMLLQYMVTKAEYDKQDKTMVDIANPVAFNNFLWSCKAIKEAVSGEDVEVQIMKPSIKRNRAAIRVEADVITIKDASLFKKIAGYANNMEVYPLLNHKICMAFSFTRFYISTSLEEQGGEI